MLQLFLIVVVLIGIAFLGLGFNIFFRRTEFPEHEVGHNKHMRELGISCAKCDEWKSFNKKRRYKQVKLDISKISL